MIKIKNIQAQYSNDIDFVKDAFISVGKKKDYHWKHAFKTLNCIRSYGLRHGEISKQILRDLCFASLGHDILEDTKVSQKEIEKKWGRKTLEYVKKMTNKEGDTDFTNYIKQLKNGDEEVLLLKLADIHSNVFNSVKTFNDLNIKWVKSFWLPLLDTYNRELFSNKFKKYPKTSFALIRSIKKEIIVLKKLARIC